MSEGGVSQPATTEIPISSNGDPRQIGHDKALEQDLQQVMDAVPDLNESSAVSDGYEGNLKGVLRQSGMVKDTPLTSPSPTGAIVAPSQTAASRLAAQASMGPPHLPGAQVVETTQNSSIATEEGGRGVALEKLEFVKKWSVNTYKCTKQVLSERFGRGSKTVDLQLEAQIEILRDTQHKYENVLRLAHELTRHFSLVVQTQRTLGDTFADLSQKSPELQEEFGYNAETQRLLCKNGETLLSAINFFVSSVNTLVNKTMEDTLLTIKQYESARIEYDAYRTDLEEMSLAQRDAAMMVKIETAQQNFQVHKEKYEQLRANVSIKLKFLEENKVKVMHKQLLLFHNAVSAYFAGNQQQLEQTLKQFNINLKTPGTDKPSWLEEP
uniref:ARF interacting protein 2 n=1 Tax=Eptatretus burgeri TaxID=7764 RepID=A0A8C4R697_EPTBU